MSEQPEWFEVLEAVNVVDRDGGVIGKLRPGKRYRAVDVGPVQVTMNGPGGVVGYVAREGVQFEPNGNEPAGARDTAPPTAGGVPPGDASASSAGASAAGATSAAPRSTVSDSPPGAAPPGAAPPPPPGVPAGWRPDPDSPEIFVRYWDGSAWTEHRAPAPPDAAGAGGAAAAAAASPGPSAAVPAASPARATGRRNIARWVGGVVVLWSVLAVVRVAAATNGWGDGTGYGYDSATSIWWLVTSPWSLFFGSVAESMASWFAPGDSVWLSPLWIFTAFVGVLGLLLASAPGRSMRWAVVVFMALHLLSTSIIGPNGDFLGESMQAVVRAGIVPLAVIIALVYSMRPERAPGVGQRDQMTGEPTGG